MTTKGQRKRHVLNVPCFSAFQLVFLLKVNTCRLTQIFLCAGTYNGKKKVSLRFKGNLTKKLTNSEYFLDLLYP